MWLAFLFLGFLFFLFFFNPCALLFSVLFSSRSRLRLLVRRASVAYRRNLYYFYFFILRAIDFKLELLYGQYYLMCLLRHDKGG